MSYKFIIFILSGLVFQQAQAQILPAKQDAKITAGVLASIRQSAYHTDDSVTAIPLFLYDNNRYYLEGSDAGFYPYKDNKHWVRVGINYDRLHFNPKDAKTSDLQGLDKSHASINTHISYMYISAIGGIEAKIATDVLGRSDGQTAHLAHRSKFDLLDEKLTIYPKMGVVWHSKKYNDYYYGVSDQEAIRTNVRSYKAKDGVSPFISVSGEYKFTDKMGVFANVRHDWLSSAQKNSPMTDDKTETYFNVGLTYDF